MSVLDCHFRFCFAGRLVGTECNNGLSSINDLAPFPYGRQRSEGECEGRLAKVGGKPAAIRRCAVARLNVNVSGSFSKANRATPGVVKGKSLERRLGGH